MASDLNYEQSLGELIADSFSFSDFYTKAWREMGHEAHHVVQNADWIQKKFADEKGLSFEGLSLLTDQVKFYKPEILFLDTIDIPLGWVTQIRREVPSIKKIGIFKCSPLSWRVIELFKECDFVITCHHGMNLDYKSKGLNSFHVFHGFGEEILGRIGGCGPVSNGIVFSGSLIAGTEFHNQRVDTLEKFVANEIPLDIHANIAEEARHKLLIKQVAYSVVHSVPEFLAPVLNRNNFFKRVRMWKEMPHGLNLSRALKSRCKPPVFGLDMYRTLKKHSVVFNSHGGVTGNFTSNMRVFEATGVGSCLLTDHMDDFKDLFEPGVEAVVYRSPEECLELAKWLMNNPKKAAEIGRAGQRRTLRDHTHKKRAAQMAEIFKSLLK